MRRKRNDGWTMSQQISRNRSLDMAKGLMILWVPTVHLIRWDLIPESIAHVPETVFCAIMVSFFVLSGYVYKPEKRTYFGSVGHRFARLLKPFAIWSVLILIADALLLVFSGKAGEVPGACLTWLNSALANQNIFLFNDTSSPLYVLMHSQMAAFWFIGTMLVTGLFFSAAAPLVKKSRWGTAALAVVLLFLSGLLRMTVAAELPFVLQEVPAWTAAMLLGCLARQLKVFEKCPLKPKWFLLSCIPVLAALWFLYPLTGFGSDLGDPSVIWHPAARVVMSFMQLYVIVFLFQLLKEKNPVGRFFEWVGRNTLTILLSHMLFASLLSLITHLYFLGTAVILYPDSDRFSAPDNAVLQGILLWIITVAVCFLFCFVKEQIMRKIRAPKEASNIMRKEN